MKNILTCAVAMGNSMNELLHNISLAEKESSLVEVRVDYLLDPTKEDLLMSKNSVKKEIVITCRRKDEGGKWIGSEQSRLHCLQTAYDLEFDYVDIELKTLEEKNFSISN